MCDHNRLYNYVYVAQEDPKPVKGNTKCTSMFPNPAAHRYWGLVRELQRLRAIEEERRVAWEARIRASRDKMVAIRRVLGHLAVSVSVSDYLYCL